MGYFNLALKGVGWMGGLRVITRTIAFVRTAILARLLLPAQFGLFGIASIVLAFLEVLTETGINIFLIQKKKGINEYIDSAWVVSIIRGILISVLIFLSAPFVAGFFNSPDSEQLIRLIALPALIRGFINPSVVKFQKELRFNKEFWYQAMVFTADSMVAVGIAYVERSASSLVWGMVAGSIVEVILSFILIKPIPKLMFNKAKIKEIFHKGKWITLSGIFTYLSKEGDDVFVGKLLGTTQLGLYRMAFRLTTLPVSEVAGVINKVALPVYVQIKGDRQRLKSAYIKTTFTIFSIIFPVSLIMFFFPEIIVRLVLGNNWVEASPILRVLSVYTLTWASLGSVESMLYSLEQQHIVAKVKLVKLVVLGLSIIPLINTFGVVGAAYSALASVVSVIPFYLYYSYHFLWKEG